MSYRPLTIICLLITATLLFTWRIGFTEPTKNDKDIEEFNLLLVADQSTKNPCCLKASAYINKLPADRQQLLAEHLLDNPIPEVRCIAASALVVNERVSEAIPSLANLIVDGHEQCLANLIKTVAHVNDSTVMLRLLIESNEYLLNNLASYQGNDISRVEKFLSGGLFIGSTGTFSRAKVEAQIANWKNELKSTPSK